MTAELRLTGVTAGYTAAPVLAGISTCFHAGTLSAVLGPNGAGKTTLLKVIAGLLKPTAGAVNLGEVDLLPLASRRRAKLIALVPQLVPEGVPFTVREAVSLARYPYLGGRYRLSVADRQVVDAALADLRLESLSARLCSALSGGELRRVFLAQGLAQEPQVLLLDEPTAFLDPPARWHVLEQAAAIARARGIIVIAVLHDPQLAHHHAGWVVLLREGRIVAAGAPAQVLTAELMQQTYDAPLEWCVEVTT